MSDPEAGNYVLKVIYYAAPANDWEATIQPMVAAPEQVVPTGVTEAFTFTCETPDGDVLASREITIARGEQLEIKAKDCGSRRAADTPGDGPGGGGQGGGDGAGGGGDGGSADGAGDTTAPKQTLSGQAKQDVDKLALIVGSDEAGTAAGQASVRVPGAKKQVKSKPASVSVGANQSAKLRFKFSKQALRAIKAAIDEASARRPRSPSRRRMGRATPRRPRSGP